MFIQESPANSQRYDCVWCQENDFRDPGRMGQDGRRKCFFLEQEIPIKVPVFGPSARDLAVFSRVQQWDEDFVDRERFVEVLVDTSLSCPLRHSHAMCFGGTMDTYFGGICPQSLVDDWALSILNLEAACKQYGCVPYGTCWYDQPGYVREAFLVIASARNQYEKMMWKSKSGTKQVSGGAESGGTNEARHGPSMTGFGGARGPMRPRPRVTITR